MSICHKESVLSDLKEIDRQLSKHVGVKHPIRLELAAYVERIKASLAAVPE